MSRKELATFETRIEAGDNGCWQWVGRTLRGYGQMHKADRSTTYAHRWSYEYHRDEIPEGLQIDHLCRNTGCVNPWHLEPVTSRVNILRSTNFAAIKAAATHCPRGHEYAPDNIYSRPDRKYGSRLCVECRRLRDRLRRPPGSQRRAA